MSNAPRDPFERPGYDEPSGTGADSSAPKNRNVWLWVIGIVAGVGILGGLACCGSIFFAYQWGAGMLGEELRAELQGDPTIREHLGDVESAEMSLTATAQENQDRPGDDLLVFDVQGNRGEGQVVARQEAGGVKPTELILADGTRHPLSSSDDLMIDADDIGLPDFDAPADEEPADEEPAEP